MQRYCQSILPLIALLPFDSYALDFAVSPPQLQASAGTRFIKLLQFTFLFYAIATVLSALEQFAHGSIVSA